MRRIIRELDDWLNSSNPNLGKQKLPGFKQLWKSGDLREKLVATNAKINSIQRRWQVRRVFRFRRRAVLTTMTARCVCKSIHSHLRQPPLGNLGDWTLLRLKLQLCSNRYSACSSWVSQCIHKSNRLASVTKRPRWVSIHACRYILMGIFLRKWPIQLHP